MSHETRHGAESAIFLNFSQPLLHESSPLAHDFCTIWSIFRGWFQATLSTKFTSEIVLYNFECFSTILCLFCWCCTAELLLYCCLACDYCCCCTKSKFSLWCNYFMQSSSFNWNSGSLFFSLTCSFAALSICML